jgi:chromosome segregation ATPase
MAPKAAAPKVKAEAKKPKKDNPEDEIPKVPQPDREAHEETVKEKTNAIEALQAQIRAISSEIQGKSSGKEEFLMKKNELRMHLDECSKKLDALQEQKTGILGQVGDRVAEGKEMKAQLNKMKKSLGYTSEDAIDERIASIEYRMWTESITLK